MWNKLDCLIMTTIWTCWGFIRYGHTFVTTGHKYVETENNERRQVLTCKKCGHESVGWFNETY